MSTGDLIILVEGTCLRLSHAESILKSSSEAASRARSATSLNGYKLARTLNLMGSQTARRG